MGIDDSDFSDGVDGDEAGFFDKVKGAAEFADDLVWGAYGYLLYLSIPYQHGSFGRAADDWLMADLGGSSQDFGDGVDDSGCDECLDDPGGEGGAK